MTVTKAIFMRQTLLAGATLALLAGCDEPFDLDMRNLGGDTLDTSQAVQAVPNRPRPDERGVISYPDYQVAVAQRDDTVRSMAGRLGLDPVALASYNGIDPDVKLRRDEVIALPTRIATGGATVAPTAIQSGTIDVTTLAGAAIDRAGAQGNVRSTTLAPATAAGQAPTPFNAPPIRHQVGQGETAFTIARLYNVPVRSIAEWNGLGADLAVRQGQYLLIPAAGATPPTIVVEQPGTGSATPTPPSAAAPLPAETPAPAAAPTPPPAAAPALPTTPAANSSAQLAFPVQGSIIRAYAKGRNEGIDIGAPAGTPVKAAAAGTVAAITTDTNGVAIVVIRHDGGLLTVYTNIDSLAVARGDTVSRGQAIAKVRASDPSFLHFEVRQGTASVDPMGFLP